MRSSRATCATGGWRPRRRASACGRPAAQHRGGRDRAARLRRRARAGGAAGRADRAGRRRDAGCRLRRPLARTDARDRGSRCRRRHHHRAGRRAAASGAGRGGGGGPVLPARHRRARHLPDRRQRLHQRRRQPRAALRHGARAGAGAGGGAGRRHHRLGAQQDAQEQRRLRPQADLHRRRGHARRHHAHRAAPLSAPAQRLHGAVRARRLRAGAATAGQRAGAISAANSRRSR